MAIVLQSSYAVLPVGGVLPVSTGLVLEDWLGSSIRLMHDGTQPIARALPGNQGGTPQQQSLALDTTNHLLKNTLIAYGSGGTQESVGSDTWFFTRGDNDSYSWPFGFSQFYTKYAPYDASYNRLVIPMKLLGQTRLGAPGLGIGDIECGNYFKSHDYAGIDPGFIGGHFYWNVNGNWRADEWTFIFLSPAVGSEVQGGYYLPDYNIDYDVTFGRYQGGSIPAPYIPATHIFDALTLFYVDDSPFGQSGLTLPATYAFGPIKYYKVDDTTEPIFTYQSSVDPTPVVFLMAHSFAINYNPSTSTFDFMFQCAKHSTVQYQIAYSDTSMKAAGGWASGTWDGTTLDSTNSAYCGVAWTSPVLSRPALGAKKYFGIKPITGGGVSNPNSLFTEIWYETMP